MYRPQLGVSLIQVSRTLDDELFAALTHAHVATVEVAQHLDGQMLRTDLEARLADCGVRPASVHAKFGADLDPSSDSESARGSGLLGCLGAVDMAADLGAAFVVVHASSEPVDDDERGRRFDTAVTTLTKVAEEAADHGVRLAVEFLPRSCLGNTAGEMLRLLNAIDNEAAGACLDVNHLMDGYAHLPEIVGQLGEHLLTLHISDYDGVDEKHWMPTEGVIDWAAFLAALDAAGYDGPFNYECGLPGDTPAEKLAAAEENFRRLTAASA